MFNVQGYGCVQFQVFSVGVFSVCVCSLEAVRVFTICGAFPICVLDYVVNLFAWWTESMQAKPGEQASCEIGPMAGTSMATPVVAGVAAMIRQYFVQVRIAVVVVDAALLLLLLLLLVLTWSTLVCMVP